MARSPTPAPAAKRPAHRPTIAPELRKVTVPVRLGPADRDNLALARHLFNAPDDAKALRRALEYAVLSFGQHLTDRMRSKIIAAAREAV